ncbi:MAG TPA: hypothetical protein VMV53_11530 [Acidimicrobiales bacterium]|nr:hypothetical protein [Acidimicrobiales bacterium]
MTIETTLIEIGFAAVAIAIAVGAPLFGMNQHDGNPTDPSSLHTRDTDTESTLVSS